jgi:hypothetical protein
MSTPSSPSSPLRLLRDFPDWHSPIVVKEMRHGLRTRFFTIALLQLHVALGLLMISALAGASQEIITNTFWGITLVLLLAVMPVRGFAALSSESRGGTLDMLTLTSISSFRITYGKWLALFSQTLLVASSLLPYMVARYQFGGVEIPREMAALAVLVLASALSTAALVGFSSQKSILLRMLLLVGVGITTFPFAIMVMVALIETVGDDVMRNFLNLEGWEQSAMIGGLLLYTGYGVYVFLSLGASRIAPPSENHSTVKRLVAFGVIGLLGVVGCCLATIHPNPNTTAWVLMPAVIFTLIVGVDVMTEAMPRYPTVAAPFVARGRFAQLLGRVLYPGWASGVVFYFVLCLPVAAAGWCTWTDTYSAGRLDSDVMAFICVLAANVVPVCVRICQKNRFAHWWTVQLILFTLGALIIAIVEVTGLNRIGTLGLATPGTAIMALGISWSYRNEFTTWAVVIGFLWVLLAVCLAAIEMRTYRRLEAEVATLKPPQKLPVHEPAE